MMKDFLVPDPTGTNPSTHTTASFKSSFTSSCLSLQQHLDPLLSSQPPGQ